MGERKTKTQRERGASSVVQWLRICLSSLGTWVQSLVKKLRSSMFQSTKACALQVLKPKAPRRRPSAATHTHTHTHTQKKGKTDTLTSI